MGGWEQAGEDEVKDDNFSFTFRVRFQIDLFLDSLDDFYILIHNN